MCIEAIDDERAAIQRVHIRRYVRYIDQLSDRSNIATLGVVDLRHPHNDLGMGATGDVLMAMLPLAAPLSGRQIAQRAGRSPSQVAALLSELVVSGIVLATPAPPSILYEINREHVLVSALDSIAASGISWRDKAAALVSRWATAPAAVVVFGSSATEAARGTSDIDVLVLRPRGVAPADEPWQVQLLELRQSIHRWTGNEVEVLELTSAALRRNSRLHADVLRDGIVLFGALLGGLA